MPSFSLYDNEFISKVAEQVGDLPGTYVLLWEYQGTPKRIQRLLGIDPEGILYIGKTEKRIVDRVSSLQRAILNNCSNTQALPNPTGHKALSKKFFRIRKGVNSRELFVRIYVLEKSPLEDESRRLEEYASKYGELPPLNSNYGQYSHWNLYT